MGSPLSPGIANFFMEDFEKQAIKQATHKPVCLYRYVDDTFVIWPHGQDKHTEFLDYLNGIHTNIKFTMEIGGGDHLPFLDIEIYRKANGSLGHKVYRKPTHTNLYLHHLSHHHPANKEKCPPPLYTEQDLSVIKNHWHKNFNSSLQSSRTMATVHNI
jgi:hypothetical protein